MAAGVDGTRRIGQLLYNQECANFLSDSSLLKEAWTVCRHRRCWLNTGVMGGGCVTCKQAAPPHPCPLPPQSDLGTRTSRGEDISFVKTLQVTVTQPSA